MKILCGPASRNKYFLEPILKEHVEIIRKNEEDHVNIVEVAAGTGEHAAFFQ